VETAAGQPRGYSGYYVFEEARIASHAISFGWRLDPGLLLCAGAAPGHPKPAPQPTKAVVGWYNGDWQSGIPGQPNWYLSSAHCSRVYEDFVVPAGGWTVVGVFSNNRMDFLGVSKAAWEIRRDMAPEKEAKRLHPVSTALARRKIGRLRAVPRGLGGWVSHPGGRPPPAAGAGPILAERGSCRKWAWFANATLGKNAVGEPPGNNGEALSSRRNCELAFGDAEIFSLAGEVGRARDFSLGVLGCRTPATTPAPHSPNSVVHLRFWIEFFRPNRPWTLRPQHP